MKRNIKTVSLIAACTLCLLVIAASALFLLSENPMAKSSVKRTESDVSVMATYGTESLKNTNPELIAAAYRYNKIDIRGDYVLEGYNLKGETITGDVALEGFFYPGVQAGTDIVSYLAILNDAHNPHVPAYTSSANLKSASGVHPASQSAQTINTETFNTDFGSNAKSLTTTENADGAGDFVDTLVIGDNVIPYVDSYQTATAPTYSAGLWLGEDSVDDGSWGYFIGHNPGLFSCLLGIGKGSAVTVWDDNGHDRTYHVIDIFNVPNNTEWSDISDRVTGYDESIILQTCIDGGANYRIYVAD